MIDLLTPLLLILLVVLVVVAMNKKTIWTNSGEGPDGIDNKKTVHVEPGAVVETMFGDVIHNHTHYQIPAKIPVMESDPPPLD